MHIHYKIDHSLLTLILIIAAMISLSGCRTTMLNQTGEVLPKGKGESTLLLAAGVATNSMATVGPFLDAGYRQRYGLTDSMELQVLSDIHYFMSFHDAYDFVYIYGRVNCEVGLKLRLFSKNSHSMALLPYFGMYGGLGRWNFRLDGFLGIYTGLKWIGSYRFVKNNSVSFYYGMVVEAGEDLLGLRHTVWAVERGYQAAAPLLDVDMGLVVGWQYYKELTDKKEKKRLFSFYHELGCTVSLNSSLTYDPVSKTVIEASLNPTAVTAYYSFAFGGQYSLKKRKKIEVLK